MNCKVFVVLIVAILFVYLIVSQFSIFDYGINVLLILFNYLPLFARQHKEILYYLFLYFCNKFKLPLKINAKE